MSLFGRAVRLADRAFPRAIAHAHCDIPCGIYDPHDPLQAAQTVIRMTELIQDLQASGANDVQAQNAMARYVTVKEEHGRKAKDDLLIIWTDYFKPEHLEKHPDLHDLVWQACKLGSQAKQKVDMDAAVGFKAAIQKVADIFWQTKQAA